MTDTQRKLLFTINLRDRLIESGRKILSYALESDGRRQPRVFRELLAGGYVAKSGKDYFATDKVWEETADMEVDLIFLWNQSRETWNTESRKYVRLSLLSEGVQKTIVQNPDDYQWYVHNSLTVSYSGGKDQVDDCLGPVDRPHEDLQYKLKALYNQMKYAEIVISSVQLQKYADKVVSEETADSKLRTSLVRGLKEQGIVTDEQSKFIDLGYDPHYWASMYSHELEETQKKLRALHALGANMDKVGGWNVFIERLKQSLTNG